EARQSALGKGAQAIHDTLKAADLFAGLPGAAGERAAALSAALRRGSSPAGRKLPEAGRFARAVGAKSSAVRGIAEAAPIVSLVSDYAAGLASGKRPNEAM